jgi:hypothetical protein
MIRTVKKQKKRTTKKSTKNRCRRRKRNAVISRWNIMKVQPFVKKKMRFRKRVRGGNLETTLTAVELASDIAQSLADPAYAITLMFDPEKISQYGKLMKMKMHERFYEPPPKARNYLSGTHSKIYF